MKSPSTKKPDDYKIIGLFIYPVLTDHRPVIFPIGGLVDDFHFFELTNEQSAKLVQPFRCD